RIISGNLTIERAPVDLAMVVGAAVDSARPAATAAGVTLLLDMRAAVTVEGDAGRLQQVASNLVSNAIKFTPRGGEVRVMVDAEGAQVRIVVADSGEGVDAAFLPHMFDRFAQGGAHAQRRGGLGLGLSIVRHLVEFHGGQVGAESAGPGRGTVMTVSLPAAAAPPALSAAPALELASLDGLRVLVVDDHDDGREMTATVLEQCGARVCRAACAKDAVMEALLDDPDIVVSDIAMPGDDGYALLAQLRALKRRPFRAVALTAFATAGDRARALEAGFDDHLAKPVEPQTLVQTLRRLAGQGARP
ncbi:MAG: hybrid sensor histidine kinase/response regulator, partial [Vicinamibacterales bacterium]